jgi:hypothetical protein
MSDQAVSFALLISSDIPQQERWDFNKQVNQIEGVTADLREERNIVYDTIMMVVTIVGPVVAIAEGVKSVSELATLLYEFTHTKEKGYDVTINKNGTKVEIKDMSKEDIEKLISGM